MVTGPDTTKELLDRADVERAAGRGDVAARLYDEAGTRCRAADDLDGWTRALLGAAAVHLFGADPGKLPAQLYDVLARTTDDGPRARLAAALARCWAYAGQPLRAGHFADEAVQRAERAGAPELIADCLDAALAAHWGPDELDLRRSLVARLDDVAAHVMDPDVRLQAHLWGLQVACEVLDLQALHRQLRALERLGEESDRALFFSASRRLMFDLLRGRNDTAARLTSTAETAAQRAGLADAWMVLKAMDVYSAALSGDTVVCAAGAAEVEAFGLTEGVTVVCAEAAFLWVCAGEPDHARALVDTFRGPVLDELPRDVNWLLTLQSVLEAALAVADREVVATAARLLTPYRDRAVINAGAVMFHGVTDDTLARAADLLGDPDTAIGLRARALETYDRLGATWWGDRLRSWRPAVERPTPDRSKGKVHLHPAPGGLYLLGRDGQAVPMRALRGYGYLRELLRRPGRQVAALDLVGAGSAVVVQSGVDGPLDEQALRAYRRRLRELDADLAEATEWSDIGRLDSIESERDALLTELAGATGLGGRTRNLTGSSQERARIAVKKAITAAIDRIATVDEPLAQHLRTAVTTGLSCSYDPQPADTGLDWVLD